MLRYFLSTTSSGTTICALSRAAGNAVAAVSSVVFASHQVADVRWGKMRTLPHGFCFAGGTAR